MKRQGEKNISCHISDVVNRDEKSNLFKSKGGDLGFNGPSFMRLYIV